ncbi:MAG: hypothetical protein Q9227_008450 [Pyrenula ochraceoflavens]
MVSRKGVHRWFVAYFIFSATSPALSQQCNTADNPTCGHEKAFDALCCPYPNICYWANRQKQAACCPAGQTCLTGGEGGEPASTITPVVRTTLSTIAQPESTTSTYTYTEPHSTTAVVPVGPPATTISTIQQPITTTQYTQSASTTTYAVTTTGENPTTTIVTGASGQTAPGGGSYVTGDGTLVSAKAAPHASVDASTAFLISLITAFIGIMT